MTVKPHQPGAQLRGPGHQWTAEHDARLREFFQIPAATVLGSASAPPELSDEGRSAFAHYGLEWHVVPSEHVVPFDERYAQKMYPSAGPGFVAPLHHGASLFALLQAGHRRHMGQWIAVERTQKPGYLPGNQQFYGSAYGFAAGADPLVGYMGRAGFTTRTRYDHNYGTLSELIRLIQQDWASAGWLPDGYRVSICPPAVFNMVGTVFHPEWSATASLELGFYRDDHGNAQCFSVGPNSPGDLSFVHQVETDSEWPLLGFRLALVPEATIRR